MPQKVVPMFHVPDVRRTVDWYREIGFGVTETHGDGRDGLSFAIVSFGAGEVMFSAGGRTSPQYRREVDLYAYVEDVDTLYEGIKDRVEVVEGPHDMFYGMREVIVRDLNGFWITFGRPLTADELTPWPAVDEALLQPYAGRYRCGTGLEVLITVQEGRLLAFPEDASGTWLKPAGGDAFTPRVPDPGRVAFEREDGVVTALVFQQAGETRRCVRVT